MISVDFLAKFVNCHGKSALIHRIKCLTEMGQPINGNFHSIDKGIILIIIRNKEIRVWFLSMAISLLMFSGFACGGGEKTVPTVDVPKGGKDTTSRDISNPLETKSEARPAPGSK